MSWSKLWDIVKDMEAWRAAIHGVRKSQMWLNDWTIIATTTKEIKDPYTEEYSLSEFQLQFSQEKKKILKSGKTWK